MTTRINGHPVISIIDYNMGNICSITNALDYLSIPNQVVSSAEQIERAERLLLPGVGGFSAGMRELSTHNLDQAILAAVTENKTPLLGICLGMQLLAETGEEGGSTTGLGLIPGTVKKMQPKGGLKIPHMGWSAIQVNRQSRLLNKVTAEMDFYFVHSFHFDCPSSYAAAYFDYGGEYIAAVEHGNIFGAQFHPEKSQHQGLGLLKRFAEL